MAVHKITVDLFIDGEGRDEETVAQEVSSAFSAFGVMSEQMAGFPQGTYLGADVVRVAAPSQEELAQYTEGS